MVSFGDSCLPSLSLTPSRPDLSLFLFFFSFSRSHAVDCEWPGDEGVGACSNCFFSYSLVSLEHLLSSLHEHRFEHRNRISTCQPSPSFCSAVRRIHSSRPEATLRKQRLLAICYRRTGTPRRRTDANPISATWAGIPFLLQLLLLFLPRLRTTLLLHQPCPTITTDPNLLPPHRTFLRLSIEIFFLSTYPSLVCVAFLLLRAVV